MHRFVVQQIAEDGSTMSFPTDCRANCFWSALGWAYGQVRVDRYMRFVKDHVQNSDHVRVYRWTYVERGEPTNTSLHRVTKLSR